jgi:hypothetical protein
MASHSNQNAGSPESGTIAARAYELYLCDGREGDHALEHWLRAEEELTRVNGGAPRRKKPRLANSRQRSASLRPLDAWCSGLDVPEDPYSRRYAMAH